MEEQRARQEDEARKAVAASVSEAAADVQKMEGRGLAYAADLATAQLLVVIVRAMFMI